MSVTMKYVTPPCMICHERSTVVVDMEQFAKWENGAMIQDAFPTTSPEQRELIKTGTHPACWDRVFGLDEE